LLVPLVSSGGGNGVGTGTSFATPVVSGSIALIENAWPILKTNGTAENLLLATAVAAEVKSAYRRCT
jgi:subtilisin family serine protease